MMPIVMIYQSDNAAKPQLLSLQRDYTDEQFVAFMGALCTAIQNAMGDGYDHQRVSVQVLVRDGMDWKSQLLAAL